MTHPAQLKVELAVHGMRLDESIETDANGVGHALDLVLPEEYRVSVPVASPSPFVLTAEAGRHVLLRHDGDGLETLRVWVRMTPPARFLEGSTRRGTPMASIAGVHGNHLVIHLGGGCGFSLRGTPCGFCVEGGRVASDREMIAVEDVIAVVRAAFDAGACDDVYFNSGLFDTESGGVARLVPYVEAVRKHFDTMVAMQVHPPADAAWIDRTYAMGVDALSYNLEIYDPEALLRHCIGRARYIGAERYLESLAHAARVFPSGTVWTELVIGLEPAESTLAGIDALTAAGVVPVASIVRGEHAPAADEVAPILAHLYRAVKERGIGMGWVRDLGLGITPLEARYFAGDGARLAVTVQNLTRSRLGALATRGLARFRRRLRVRKVNESFESAHL